MPVNRKRKKQHLHRKPAWHRDAIGRKMDTHHRFIQTNLIAQGDMVALATTEPALLWRLYGSGLRTMRSGIAHPVSCALQRTLHHFLAGTSPAHTLAKFIQERLDLKQTQARKVRHMIICP